MKKIVLTDAQKFNTKNHMEKWGVTRGMFKSESDYNRCITMAFVVLYQETENGYCDYEYTYQLPDGRKVSLGKANTQFVEQCRTLPVDIKCNIMGLGINELEKYIDTKKRAAKEFLIELLGYTWYWRLTGEFADFSTYDQLEIEELKHLKITPDQMLKKCKSKRPPSKSDIDLLINFYTGENSELYRKN